MNEFPGRPSANAANSALRRLLASCAALALVSGCDRARPARYLALGDSYTIGESVAQGDRWPVQLAAVLKSSGDDLGPPQIVARTGWTTGELLDAMDATHLDASYRLVTLMIGVNDQFRHLPIDGFTTRVGTLLDRSIALAGHDARHVVAISIPDWGVTPFAEDQDRAEIAASIDAFNVACAAECSRRHVAFVDVTAISRAAATQPTALVAPDGLHPSAAMYARWTTAIAPAALVATRSAPVSGAR